MANKFGILKKNNTEDDFVTLWVTSEYGKYFHIFDREGKYKTLGKQLSANPRVLADSSGNYKKVAPSSLGFWR